MIISQSSPHDARRLELRLSPQGRKILEASPEIVQDRLISAIEILNPGDRRELKRLLELVLGEAHPQDKPARMFFEEDFDS